MLRRLYQDLIVRHFSKNRQMLFLMGPRQVGKTTLGMLSGEDASGFHYFNWDNLDDRATLIKGPKAIREAIGEKALKEPPVVVFDEIHKFRDWKTLLKGFFDTYAHSGELRIIVTGSARLEMFNSGGDSLMGRYLRYRIHPLTIGELLHADPPKAEVHAQQELENNHFDALYHFGGFPEPYLKKDEHFAEQWKGLRHQQLFKEEISELTHIHEVKQLELLALQLQNQVGAVVSYTNLSKKVRVSIDTIRRWVNALIGLYFCFEIRPWSTNIPRAILKEPKVYLWDWSLISDPGSKAENFIAAHLHKAVHYWTDAGLGDYCLHYIRDKEKREVDFVVTKNQQPWFLIEVKNGHNERISPNLYHFHELTGAKHAFQAILNMPYEDVDCFTYTKPVLVSARTLLSQLI